MTSKTKRAQYTLEFELEAVRLVHGRTKHVSPERMELARLRAEVARLKMERDILEKCAAYFANESV
ncbi:hypothetical protein R69749_07441 [Paraburkholderia domus]|uniref:Transposase n=1 Tax=Paraburkholderia domus TaxID=2793075 RepID=A0A9N8R4M8_9BURK|nr:hypothetical protein R70006_08038 [Paraburkholderia domus]CAE6888112.1 hypothetical protein R69749_07441 [Paraburkholderia domus]CAE6964628.1 hypothetical protein R70211_07243 [Paraburkholderia domus]CAE6968803.1 hypothetical protein R70199_07976 [Paraburkholderia domus]